MTRAHIHINDKFGARLADIVATGMGSWRFIIVQTILVMIWMTVNIVGWAYHWDEFPFILLNLLFSTQAAYAAPIIMMSQNRQAAKDRQRDDRDDAEIGEILTLAHDLHVMQKEQMASHKKQLELLKEVMAK